MIGNIIKFNGYSSGGGGGSVNPDDYFDPTTHTATEADFIAFLEAGGKYDDKSLVGYKVQLSQTSGYYNNGIWVIADVGHHADQPNTYDLIPQDCFYNRSFGSSQYWRNSSVRTWLNGTFYNGFSADFKSHMNNITYDSNGSTYNDDKVILPSFTEVNGTTGTSSSYFVTEGTAYPIFTDNSSRIKKYNGSAQYWWTRSRNTNGSTNVWYVLTDGIMYYSICSSSNYLAPLLRIS